MKDTFKSFAFKAKEDILANPEASIATSLVVATGLAITTANSVFLTKLVITKTSTGTLMTFVKAGLFSKVVALTAGVALTALAGYTVYNYVKRHNIKVRS